MLSWESRSFSRAPPCSEFHSDYDGSDIYSYGHFQQLKNPNKNLPVHSFPVI